MTKENETTMHPLDWNRIDKTYSNYKEDYSNYNKEKADKFKSIACALIELNRYADAAKYFVEAAELGDDDALLKAARLYCGREIDKYYEYIDKKYAEEFKEAIDNIFKEKEDRFSTAKAEYLQHTFENFESNIKSKADSVSLEDQYLSAQNVYIGEIYRPHEKYKELCYRFACTFKDLKNDENAFLWFLKSR